MEIFYSEDIAGGYVRLDAEESAHCVRVLRHREGDSIVVVDGAGTMYHCTIASVIAGRDRQSRGVPTVVARIDSTEPGWHGHPYRLTMAVCPTKNIDRYEWMVEKLTEIGVDRIVPVIGDRSERRILKTDRLRRLIVSAGKQSLKAAFPALDEPVSVRDFVRLPIESGVTGGPSLPAATGNLKFIAYCSDEVQPRADLYSVIAGSPVVITGRDSHVIAGDDRQSLSNITILIGPEGDFSPEEVRAAMDAGFIPVHLGESRLRTETAAIVAATAVYLRGTQLPD
ncbi:MAG: 16S rRNA (uracil(1498)-N(3))-methyltransferase [Bacteroidales bacterium]|nr:16S rRNA (uracil(1498)-N(3))-methyltransferase [Bacteroidales bacterium]